MYHSSVVARERDRLRQQVLERLGWKDRLYRVWSTDWYRDAPRCKKKLLAAVEQAKRIPFVSTDRIHQHEVRANPETVETHPTTQMRPALNEDEDRLPDCVIDYSECTDIGNVTGVELNSAPIPVVATAVVKVVKEEAPIHREELVRRVRTLWGYSRTGDIIRDRVHEGIRHAISKGHMEERVDFLYKPSQKVFPIRQRENPKIDLIANEEIDASLRAVVDFQYATHDEEMVTRAARFLGIMHTGINVKSRVNSRLKALLKKGSLMRNLNGLIDTAD